MEQDKHSKTEEASPKKLKDSRKKGQVAKSKDLNSAVSFLAFSMLLGSLGTYLFKHSKDLMRYALSDGLSVEITGASVGKYLIELILQLFIIILPFALLAIFIGILTSVVQVGFMFTVDPLKPDFKKLNPIKGFKNIFSKKSLFTLFKSLVKLAIVGFLGYRGFQQFLKPTMNLGGIGVEGLFPFFIRVVKSISINISGFMLILGIVDFVFEKKTHNKELMMTKQEIKDEYKQMEGDPKIKSKRQQMQREMSMARTMESVDDSTVVITNPTHIAIALRYEQGKDDAPVVMAKGLDYKAMQMKERAKERGITIIENKPLARAMYYEVEPGSSVPVELYQAVAEVLAVVITMNKKK